METKFSKFLNVLITTILYVFIGALVGGVIGVLTVYIGSWALVFAGLVVAIILILNDE